jgi:hypothetical protein
LPIVLEGTVARERWGRMHVWDDARMKRITVSLPDDPADEIVRASRIRRKSVSEIVRKSLSKDFCATDSRPLAFANLTSGPDQWSAAELDEFLAENWARDIERHRER